MHMCRVCALIVCVVKNDCHDNRVAKCGLAFAQVARGGIDHVHADVTGCRIRSFAENGAESQSKDFHSFSPDVSVIHQSVNPIGT